MQEKLSLVNVADSAIWQEWLAGGKLGQDGQTGVHVVPSTDLKLSIQANEIWE